MNETDLFRGLLNQARGELNDTPKVVQKRMRKKIRQLVLRDLQRCAFTGEPRLVVRAK